MTRTIDLLRHGLPVGGNRYRGHGVDDPLSDQGWDEMWAGVGDYSDWDIIVTSPMLRCRAFAEALAERNSTAMIVDDRFREIGFGEWEGKTRQQLLEERVKEFHDFYSDPVANTPAGAEPVTDFYQRVSDAFHSLRKEYVESNILIIGHAGVNRAIVTESIQAGLNSMYNIRIHNGCIARLTDYGVRLDLEGLNLKF